MAEHYALSLDIEAKLMVELFQTQILPSALKYQKRLAKSIQAFTEATGSSAGLKMQKGELKRLAKLPAKWLAERTGPR